MTEASGQWTPGVLIGLPIGLLIVLALLGCAVYMRWYAHRRLEPDDTSIVWRREYRSWSTRRHLLFWSPFVALAGLLVVGGVGLAFWPWHAEYHQYRDVTGTVVDVKSRFLSAGDQGGTEQKFVVLLEGRPQPFGITDTRAALLKKGDPVHLRCKRVYEYGSNNGGYDCKWGQ